MILPSKHYKKNIQYYLNIKDMVHLIVLQNKSAELVVSLARKRKRDHFQPAENLNYSLCRQGNTKPFFCSYEVSFL